MVRLFGTRSGEAWRLDLGISNERFASNAEDVYCDVGDKDGAGGVNSTY
jgi:hypothetical protein